MPGQGPWSGAGTGGHSPGDSCRLGLMQGEREGVWLMAAGASPGLGFKHMFDLKCILLNERIQSENSAY